jgi:hypothetical protein
LLIVFRLIMGLAIAGCAVLSAGGVSDLCFAVSATAASTPEPTASHLSAARELVVASGMSRSFAALVPQTMERLTITFTQTRPELAPDLSAVLAELRPEFDKRADQMIDTAARIFSRLMSEADIKAADAFFESQAGKKYVETQPALFNEVVNAMQDWQQTLAQDLVARVREEMKKKGHEM